MKAPQRHSNEEYLKCRCEALEQEIKRLNGKVELLSARNEVLRSQLADYLFI